MRWHFAAFVLLLFAAGCGRSPRSYVDKANQLVDAHKYQDASIYYRRAIQKDSNFADAYYGLGKLFLRQGQAREAYAALERAVQLAPQNIDAKQKLANLVLAGYLADRRRPKNLYDELNQLASQFLARDANSYDGLRIKGYVALIDNQRTVAIEDFRKALQAKPLDPEMTLSLAGALFQDPQTAADGERSVLDLIQKRKEVGAAYDLLYRYYLSSKRPAEAENMLKAKVSANPGQSVYRLELADHYRRINKTGEMKTTLAALLDDPKTFPKARLQLGDFYNQAGDREQALKYYQEGAQTATAEDRLTYQKREIATLTSLGQADRALSQAQESLQAHPKDAELRLTKALLLLDQRKADPALEELQALDQDQKNNPLVKYHLGRALLLKGHATEAVTAWQQAAKLQPAYIDPTVALASYNVDLGKFDEALRQTDQALSTAPGNVRAQIVRANALQGLGRVAEAEMVLTGLRKQLPGDVEVASELALLNLRRKKPAEAEQIFRGVYTPGQANLRPLTGLVEALLTEKKAEEARRVLEADLSKAPGRPEVQFMLANSYSLSGHPDSAIQTLQQLIAAHPDSAQAHLTLGQLQANKGTLDAAMASFQKARDLEPKSTQPLLMLAQTADRMGQNDVARQQYQAALKLDPNNVVALNNLAFLEADTGTHLDEALKLITTASQKVPSQPNLTDTLGYVYLKQKKFDSALQLFRNLAQRYPSNATFRFHHGLALLESGSKDQARKELESALAAKPAPDLATKIKQALAGVS